MNIEGKDFVIKDRRAFDEEGELKKEGSAGSETAEKEAAGQKKARPQEAGRPPLPEVSFTSLIFSLSSSASVPGISFASFAIFNGKQVVKGIATKVTQHSLPHLR